MSDMLRIALTLHRPEFALAIDLNLPLKGITSIFGPSGSGKTTLLRCVAGLEQASGTVQIGNAVWQDSTAGIFMPTWQRDVGVVFQEASLFEHMTVRQNLEYGVKRVSKPNAAAALDEAIALLGIGHLVGRWPQSLSGGERQRVAIARALATQPSILLLDEPLSSLDIRRKKEILPWLEQLHTQLSIPVLYVTHSLEELSRLADHVITLDSGQIGMHGSVQDLLPTLRAQSW